MPRARARWRRYWLPTTTNSVRRSFAHLSTVVDVDKLPPALRSADGLARAVGTIHDGAMLRLLLDPDEKALRRWLRVLLIALLDHSGDRRSDAARHLSAAPGGA